MWRSWPSSIPSEERRDQRQADWPAPPPSRVRGRAGGQRPANRCGRGAAPGPLHVDGVVELLGHGWHVNLQKPMCNDLADARRMIDAARRNDRVLRVMENYLFYEPLRRLKEIGRDWARSGPSAATTSRWSASGNGGWDVPASSYEWQFRQMQDGRGILVFDDGWHKLSTALWLFGPIREVRAWIGGTEVVPGIDDRCADARSCGSTRTGSVACGTSRSPSDLYLRSDYYTNDERWEVTGRQRLRPREPVHRSRGSSSRASRSTPTVRCGFHDALDDDWASSFRDSGRHWLRWLHTGDGRHCGGAPRRRLMSCGSPSPRTRAATAGRRRHRSRGSSTPAERRPVRPSGRVPRSSRSHGRPEAVPKEPT